MSDQKTKQDTTMMKTDETNKKLSEIRIVLTGGRELFKRKESGRSSVGNIILGREAFVVGRRTARSVQASGQVHERHVTVVDTPGWPWHYSVKYIPKFDRLEIMRSPTLCPPGPHAFLLVIPIDSAFPNSYRMALENQLKFLSETVWRHIIVVFSSIAPFDDRAVENNVKKWADLQQILRKCQNRYHILDINKKNDSFQVIELLEKIEKMVKQNNGKCFQIDKIVSLEEKRGNSTRQQTTKKIHAVKSKREAHIRDEKQHLTDIQIVIIGGSLGGGSSTGNFIMGKEVFKVGDIRTTIHCTVGHGEIHGRQLTVVDTPGWYCEHPLENTPEIDKLEIRRSVYLCPPGPHVILLTIPIDIAFNGPIRTGVEEHVSLLGKNVWNHIIVLFTWGDWLGDTTIEERIEAEGEHMQWLMEQCDHRHYVFDNKEHTGSTQVKELFEKIEEMVMENNGCYFGPEMDRNPSIEYNIKMETSRTNRMKVGRQRNILQELLKEQQKNLSDVRIVLLGGEKGGKSTSGNIILQRHFFDTTKAEGHEIHSRKCVMKQRQIEGRHVSVVDTPGWSTSTLESAKEILRSLTVCSPGPHAFLLVLPVRMPFTKKSQQTAEELLSLFGENVCRHTIIVFSDEFWLRGRPVEEYIACEGEALQELVKKCGDRYHVLVDDWRNRSQVRDLLKMIDQMVARNRGEYFSLEKNTRMAKSTVLRWLSGSKTLTEEEWNKREDELIDRVLDALGTDLDEESKHRRKGSFDGSIPNMSGDSGFSDANSVLGGDVLKSTVKVSDWLKSPGNKATSSGCDTMSIVSSTQYQHMEDVKIDIPVPTHPVDTQKMSAQKHSRSNSI